MSMSHLQFRAFPIVALAYLIAPLSSLTILSLVTSFALTLQTHTSEPIMNIFLGDWLGFVVTGILPCLFVELIVVTPVLVVFRRYQWEWFRGWVICAGGFLTGVLFVFALCAWDASVTGWSSNLFNYTFLILTLGAGLVGLAKALVFRMVALRTAVPSAIS
jgi:hypothetical protein